MLSVALHTKIDSDKIFLPELKPFFGKSVKITIEEEIPQKKEFLNAFFELAGNVEIDTVSIQELREKSKL